MTNLPLCQTVSITWLLRKYVHQQTANTIPYLLSRCDQHASLGCIMFPTACERFTTMLFAVLVNPLLQFMTEMPDQALQWPRKSLAKSTDGVSFYLLRQLLQ